MIKEVVLPEVAESVESGYVTRILVGVGDSVAVDQSIIELETDKAVVEVPSTEAGVVTEILVKPDTTVKVGQAIIKIDTEAKAAKTKPTEPAEVPPKTEPAPVAAPAKKPSPPPPPPEPEPEPAEPAPAVSGDVAPASPSVRRLSRELGVDITQVSGSGPGGRISEEDVKKHTKQLVTSGSVAYAGAGAAAPLPDFTRWGDIRREKMSRVRRITAEGLSFGWNTVPQVTQFDEADITEVEWFRKQYGKVVEKAGGKLTVTAILIKILAAALEVFPQFNASIDMANQEIIYKDYIHISVAVDTDRGLLVPVIRDVDRKNLTQLSLELGDIAERARGKKITPEELEGGTFSISNQGGIGGTNFTPLVYWPQVAILGVSRGAMRQKYIEGEFRTRMILPLSLSYDHRLIDGADAARFLSWVARTLEQPLPHILEA